MVELFKANGFKAEGIDEESQLEAARGKLGAVEDDIVVEIRRNEFEEVYELFLPGFPPIKMDSGVGVAINEYFLARETKVGL